MPSHVVLLASIIKSTPELNKITCILSFTVHNPSETVTKYLVLLFTDTFGFLGSVKSSPVKGDQVYVQDGFEFLMRYFFSPGT